MKKTSVVLVVIMVMISLSGCGKKSDHVVLNVFNWGDYIDDTVIEAFEIESGIQVNYETFDTNEAMYTKVKQGGTNYDVCFPSDYMIEKMISEDMLYEIDHSKLTNLHQLMPSFKNLAFDPNNTYSIPYLWGTVGILYNSKTVTESVDSWSVLWNDNYKSEILMIDSQRDTFMVAQKLLGYSMNNDTAEVMEAAKEKLIEQKPLVLAYVGDNVKDMMINEEASLAVVWSGEAMLMQESNENLEFVVPKEGTNMWFDNMIIPKSSEHKSEAEQFINFMLKPEIALKNAEYIGYSTTNIGAYDLLEESVRNNEVAYPKQKVLDQCEVYIDLGAEYIQRLDRAWTELKAN